jgi:hypothetical protein
VLIALIIVVIFALAILELWLFWMLGEHQDRSQPRRMCSVPIQRCRSVTASC